MKKKISQIELGQPLFSNDLFLNPLNMLIGIALRMLALLMTLVILWGVADVCWILYDKILEEPVFLLDINDMFSVFGAFLAVLIAIEIFMNIILYLKDNVIHVNLVVATALMAIARKVIVFDFETLDVLYVFASAAVVLSLGITYWLLKKINTSH